jgi:hypothetical protein
MARVLCINPCPASYNMPPFVKNGISVPFFDTGVKPSAHFKMTAGCDNCEMAASFMAQLQPFMMAIQLPMCILGCIKHVIDAVSAIPKAIGPPPDGTELQKIKDAILGIEKDCPTCFLGFSVFTVCAFVRDILDLIITLLNCAKQILSKLLVISLRAGGLMMDPEISIQKTGACLYGLMKIQLERTLVNLDLLGTLLKAVQLLVDFTGADIDLDNISLDLSDFDLDAPLQPVIMIIDTVATMLALPRELAAQCAAVGGY